MKFAPAPDKYTAQHQSTVQAEVMREDNRNRKKGTHIELGPGELVILLSPNGTRYALVVSNAGVLSAVAV